MKGIISSLRKPFTETLSSAAKGEDDRKWLRGRRWPQQGCIKEQCDGGGGMDVKATLRLGPEHFKCHSLSRQLGTAVFSLDRRVIRDYLGLQEFK